MPKTPSSPSSPLIRILVPLLIVVVLGGIAVWAMISNSKLSSTGAPPVAANATGAQTTPAAPIDTAAKPADQPEAAPADNTAAPGPDQTVPPTTPAQPVAPPAAAINAAQLTAVQYPAAALSKLGSLDPASGFEMEITFSSIGAGIDKLLLTNHYIDTKKSEHELLQERVLGPGGTAAAVPLALLGVTIENRFINLATGPAGENIWREIAPGSFEASVVDASGAEAFKVRRRYTIQPGNFHIDLHQELVNTGSAPLTYSWLQYGPVDLPMGTVRYGGDTRRVRFGYLLSPTDDPGQQHVSSGKLMLPRAQMLGKVGAGGIYAPNALWPNTTSTENGFTLVWAALTNRYFAAALHPAQTPQLPSVGVDKRFLLVSKIDRHVVVRGNGADPSVVMTVTAQQSTLEPGRTADLSVGMYAGPLRKKEINKDPLATALRLDGLVIYTFGGPCGICTFQPITQLLRWFLGILHDNILFDWSLAIIVLVLCVRTVLHPITKWSQVNLMRFGKQMQRLAPKQKQLQERYRDDPKTMRLEMSKLMREEQVNYAGALGCLPMFLQTPIWIALFAMLYFTSELRHEPAFFGIFQTLSGGRWEFLADLAEPDRFIAFPAAAHIPIIGAVDSINILPLLLGVVFFIQQKYLSPPMTASMSPEQLQQQRMMKIMTVVMFPLFMYNVPSGLALYTMTNSVLGILESRYIRSHVDKLDLNPPKKKTRKRSAFMDRMQQQLEAKQREMESRGKKK